MQANKGVMTRWGWLLWVGMITVLPARAETVCTPVLSAGTLNYGHLTRSDITASRQTERGRADALTTKQAILTVSCTQPTRLRLYFAGNQEDKRAFRLPPGGFYRLKAEHASVDGQTVSLLSHEQGDQPRPADSGMLQPVNPGNQLLFLQNGEVKGTTFSLQLTVQPLLRHSVFDIRDKTRLQATLNIVAESLD